MLGHALEASSLAWAAALVWTSGCVGEPTPTDLRLTAAWQPWQDDNLPHLILSIVNFGGEPGLIGPGGAEIRVSGPTEAVPLDWGETTFARSVPASATVRVALHPRLNQGSFVLAIDHAHPDPTDPPKGTYMVCLEEECARADLR